MLSAVLTAVNASQPHLDSPTPVPQFDAASVLAAVLDEIDYGLMVVEVSTGRLQHANRMALDECGDGGVLRIERGRLVPQRLDSQRAFERALHMTAQDKRSLVNLQGDSPADSISIAVVPLAGEAGEPLALLLMGKRRLCEALSVGFFARLHALTPTEDSVLSGLCRGLRPAQIAAEAGVAISTVRSQVSSIRFKTATPSISELVKKVSALPPIAPALRMARTTH